MEVLDYLMREFKKKKVDDIVLSFVVNNIRRIKFADNKIVNTTLESLRDVGVFLVKDKKILTTNLRERVGDVAEIGDLPKLQKKQIDKFIKNLVGCLKNVKAKEDYFGINDKKFKYKDVIEGYDKKVKNVDEVDLLERGMNSALDAGAKRTNGVLEIYDINGRVKTSEGIEFSDRKSEFYFSIRTFFGKDESGHMNCCSRMLDKFRVEKAGREAANIAKDAKNPGKCKRGKYDLVLSPMAFAPILMHVGESASIFYVESGMSFFSEKCDKEVGSENVTVYDDGTLPNGIGSGKADAEGAATRKNILIDKGVFKKYLHNTSSAGKYKVESTGNAGLITPEPWNVVLKKGSESLSSLIKNVKKGIYVTNVWYTRFANYHTGDFSTIPRDGAFLIENGKIVRSLKGMRISDNILRMLMNLDGVGNKPINLRSWETETPVYTPAVLIRNCNITTPTL